MAARVDTRERMVEGGLELIRRNGYQATSFRDVWTRAQTPRGSVYFHFPEGKEEFGLAVLDRHDDLWLMLIRGCAEKATSPAEFLERLARGVADDLESHDFELGCAVQAIAVEMSAASNTLREATASCYDGWTETIAAELRRLGLARDRAELLATTTVASIAGALCVARATRSALPLTRVGVALAELARAQDDHVVTDQSR